MRWSIRHVFALLLAAFVAAGLSLSSVQASDMAVKMTMASDMGMPADGGCTACPDDSTDGGKMTACPQVCIAPVLAIVPQGLAAVVVALTPHLTPMPSAYLHGRAAVPDPYPPRPSRAV
ncbi:hypothetical protein GGQ99_005201 [Aminobacter niigataensis]|uniref:Uncharacterized protein n=1 Tax=Aminobacter niigataensis TaxID=83265 RepID=A0ABR6L9K8_9HYPH|nr:hypothetical protein [Aminobacter niigataensis]MBB4653410.1 hypothetical protein [Aminobacter niigataensis]